MLSKQATVDAFLLAFDCRRKDLPQLYSPLSLMMSQNKLFMSEVLGLVIEKNSSQSIYIKLLDEGTDVYRPVDAAKLADHIYQILDSSNYDSEDETWEFLPGTIVLVEAKMMASAECLVAVGLYIGDQNQFSDV